MPRKSMRSPLAEARGLGSAKEGPEHWWRQRLSAIALIPLTLWFVASVIVHGGSDYAVLIAWLRTPFSVLLMLLLLIALFHHSALGLQVIIEDYIHSAFKIPILIMMQLSCIVLAGAGIIAVAHVAITNW